MSTRLTTHGTNPRVLVLGASGMLGHKLVQVLSDDGLETVAYARTPLDQRFVSSRPGVTFGSGVDVRDTGALRARIEEVRPSAVVNCVGIVKQLAAAMDPIPSISINSLFPHQLAEICAGIGARLIHISTDCVFSGSRGGYAEEDVSDAVDLYGRTKLLGEVTGPGCLTLRTSIIGRELKGTSGLLEWFLAQSGSVNGYTNAFFSGLTTIELSELIAALVVDHPDLEGLWHVSADRISKYDLLRLLASGYGENVDLVADDSVVIDRSLDSSRFREATGFKPRSWPDMIARVVDDSTPYEAYRP